MCGLERSLLNVADDIIYCLNVQVTKLNYRATMAAFASKNAERGVQTCIAGADSVDSAVTTFVRHHSANSKSRVVELKAILADLNQRGDDAEGQRPELVRKVFIAAQLDRLIEERTVGLCIPPSTFASLTNEQRQVLLAAVEAGFDLNALVKQTASAMSMRVAASEAATTAASPVVAVAPSAAAAAARATASPAKEVSAAAAAASLGAAASSNSALVANNVDLHPESISSIFRTNDANLDRAYSDQIDEQENAAAQLEVVQSGERLHSVVAQYGASESAFLQSSSNADTTMMVSIEQVGVDEVKRKVTTAIDESAAALLACDDVLDVTFTHTGADQTFALYNEETHVHDLRCDERFATKTQSGRRWSMRRGGQTLQQWKVEASGEVELPAHAIPARWDSEGFTGLGEVSLHEHKDGVSARGRKRKIPKWR
eukprot:COSAG06_NODE_4916_length_3861_cov_66.663477_4_plen_430_part_00